MEQVRVRRRVADAVVEVRRWVADAVVEVRRWVADAVETRRRKAAEAGLEAPGGPTKVKYLERRGSSGLRRAQIKHP